MATALLKSLDVRSATFGPCLKKGAFPCFPRLPLSFFLMSTLLRLCLPSSFLAGDPDWSEDHAERNANWSKNQKMQDYTLHTTLKLEDNVVVCYGYPTPPLFVVVPRVVVALPLFAAVPLVVVAPLLFGVAPLVGVAPPLFAIAVPLVVVAPLDAGVPLLFVAPLDVGAPCVAHHRCCPGTHLCWPFAVSLFPAAASSGKCPAHTEKTCCLTCEPVQVAMLSFGLVAPSVLPVGFPLAVFVVPSTNPPSHSPDWCTSTTMLHKSISKLWQ